METNELTSIDDQLVDTSTIHTTMNIHSLLNIDNRVGGWTRGRQAARLLPQGTSRRSGSHHARTSFNSHFSVLPGLAEFPFDSRSSLSRSRYLHPFRLAQNFSCRSLSIPTTISMYPTSYQIPAVSTTVFPSL